MITSRSLRRRRSSSPAPHVLAAQPEDPGAGATPVERHHDEMRFWADYIAGDAGYLTDDDGRSGPYTLTSFFRPEAPAAPVFIDGKKAMTLRGPDIAQDFEKMVADYNIFK